MHLDWRHLAALSCFFSLAAPPAGADVRFVDRQDKRCTDSGDGSVGTPWCSLKVAGRRARPGDKVMIRRGVYHEQLSIAVSGSPGKPIVFEGERGAVVDGSGVKLVEDGLISIIDRRHIVLRGLTSKGSPSFGIRVCRSKGIVLEKLLVERSEHGGIIVTNDSSDIQVLENELVKVNWRNAKVKNTSIHECITISNVRRFVVARNHLHHGLKEGIDVKDDSADGVVSDNHVHHMGAVGIYLCHARRIKVFRNNIHHCGTSGMQIAVGDGAEGKRRTSSNEIYQNLSWMNSYNGLEFWRTAAGEMTGNKILNNVFYGNGHQGVLIDHAERNTVRNNIIAANKHNAFDGNALGKNDLSHNLIFKNRWEGEAGESPVRGDPRLVNAATGDFHLRPGSPAIDKGIDVGLPYCGKAPDIGAYEHGCGSGKGCR